MTERNTDKSYYKNGTIRWIKNKDGSITYFEKNGNCYNGFYKTLFIDGGMIHWSECNYKDGKKNGLEKSYDTDKHHETQTLYKEGLKHGIETYADEYGIVETPFYKGKTHGKIKIYDEDNNICTEIPFVNDKMHGIIKNHSHFRQICINDAEIMHLNERYLADDLNIAQTTVELNKITQKFALYLEICKFFIRVTMLNHSINKNIIPDTEHQKNFYDWIFPDNINTPVFWTASMIERIIGCGKIGHIEMVKQISRQIIKETSDKIELLQSAEILAVTSNLIRFHDIDYVKNYILKNYNIQSINNSNMSDENIVFIAVKLFFESTSFESTMHNVSSIDADNEAILLITGSLANIYYGIPENLYNRALEYLDEGLVKIWKFLNYNSVMC